MKKKFTTYLEDELIEKLKILAIKQKRSVASILHEIISDYLAKFSD